MANWIKRLGNLQPYYFLGIIWLPSLYKALSDNKVWGWDESWYAESSLRLSIYLRDLDFQSWFSQMISTTPTKPPLLVWVSQFLGIFPVIGFDASKVFLVFQIFLVACIFFAANNILILLDVEKSYRNIFAFLLSSSSLFVGLSTHFFVEIIQVLVILIAVGALLRIYQTPTLRVFDFLIILLTLNLVLLTKLTTIVYLIPFYLITLWKFIKLRDKKILWKLKSKKEFSYVVLILLLTTISSLWFARNSRFLFNHLRLSTESEGPYTTKGGLDNNLLRMLTDVSRENLLIPTGMFAVLLTYIFSNKAISNFKQSSSGIGMWRIALASSVVISLCLIALTGVSEVRFHLPLIVMGFLLITIAMSDLGIKRLKTSMLSMSLILAAYLQVHTIGGFESRSIVSSSTWIAPLDQNPDLKEFYRSVLRDTCLKDGQGHSLMVGVDEKTLNPNTLNFLNAELALKGETEKFCNVFGINYFAQKVAPEIDKILSVRPQRFITYTSKYFGQKNFSDPLLSTSFVSKDLLSMLVAKEVVTLSIVYQDKIALYEFSSDLERLLK